MDAFESVVATLLERKGYWTRTSVKVNKDQRHSRGSGDIQLQTICMVFRNHGQRADFGKRLSNCSGGIASNEFESLSSAAADTTV
ncbi:hypothetical protein MASR2M66_32880 [Chloroflexota bacterium]